MIADAISARQLLVGTTVAEACRAARTHPKLLKSAGAAKTYRWEIHGRTGEHNVWSRDAFGNQHVDTVIDYGVVDWVDATFTDGTLSSIDSADGGDFSTTETKQEELWREGSSMGSGKRAPAARRD